MQFFNVGAGYKFFMMKYIKYYIMAHETIFDASTVTLKLHQHFPLDNFMEIYAAGIEILPTSNRIVYDNI